MNIEDFIVSPKDLAKVLDLSESRLYALVNKGVIQKLNKGEYKLVECVQSYLQYKIELLSSSSEGQKNELEKEKLILTRVKREREEIKLAAIKGDVHLSEDVESIVNDMLAGFRAKLLNIPSKVACKLENLPAVKIQLELDKEIEETLQELSEYDQQKFLKISKEYINLDVDDEED